MSGPVVHPGPADVTPIERAVEPTIRKEISDVDDRAELRDKAILFQLGELKKAQDHVLQSVDEVPGLVKRLHEVEGDRVVGELRKMRTEDRRFFAGLIAQERIDRDKKIVEVEGRMRAYTDEEVKRLSDAVDERFTTLDLKLGVHEQKERAEREEVTGSVKVTREMVETVGGEVVAVKMSVEETKTTAVAAKATADGARKSVDDLNKEVGGIKVFLSTHKKEAGFGAGGVGLGIAMYSAAPHVGGWMADLINFVKGLFQ